MFRQEVLAWQRPGYMQNLTIFSSRTASHVMGWLQRVVTRALSLEYEVMQGKYTVFREFCPKLRETWRYGHLGSDSTRREQGKGPS